jgi:hypothetical protein
LEETPPLEVSLMGELSVQRGLMETGTQWLSEMVQKSKFVLSTTRQQNEIFRYKCFTKIHRMLYHNSTEKN